MWGDLGFDRGTEIVADASELPGENQMEFPFRHGGKQHAVLCVSARLGVFMGFVGVGPSQISPSFSLLCKRKRGVNESWLWLLCASEAVCGSEAAQDSCFENLGFVLCSVMKLVNTTVLPSNCCGL